MFAIAGGKVVYPRDDAATAARTACILYKALSDEAKAHHGEDTRLWALSPKLHMWLELAEFQGRELGSPRLSWAYRDESFVGWASKLACSRGGARECASSALRLIEKYRIWIGSQ